MTGMTVRSRLQINEFHLSGAKIIFGCYNLQFPFMNEFLDYFALHDIFIRILDILLNSNIQGLIRVFLCLFCCIDSRHDLLQYCAYIPFRLSLGFKGCLYSAA